MPRRPHDAAIFDLDGTLVDTERLMFEADERVFARHGAQMTHDLFGRILGTDGPTGRQILAKALPDHDLAALEEDWHHEIQTAFDTGIPPALRPCACCGHWPRRACRWPSPHPRDAAARRASWPQPVSRGISRW